MPFKASTAQDNDALPACAHLPPRSGLVQRNLEIMWIKRIGVHVSRNLLLNRNVKDAVVVPIHRSITSKTQSEVV